MTRIYNISKLVIICSICACGGTKATSKTKKLTKEQILQRNILETLKSASNSYYEFYPKDTVIELPNETDIILWKNSFITNNGNIYHDKVSIDFEFEQDTQEVLYRKSLAITSLNPYIDLKGLIKVVIKDKKGNQLNFNPNYSTGIRFLPPAMMLGGFFFQYDSLQKLYYSVVKSFTIFNVENNEGYSNTILINNDFSVSKLSSSQDSSAKYKNTQLTYSQVIASELTLKYPGIYFIGRKAKEKYFKNTQVNISLQSSDTINWEETKVFLFSQEEDYNFYLNSRHNSNGNYVILPARGYNDIKLLLNKKFSVFAYYIKDNKSYMAVRKNIKLHTENYFTLTLKELPIDKVIKVIKEL